MAARQLVGEPVGDLLLVVEGVRQGARGHVANGLVGDPAAAGDRKDHDLTDPLAQRGAPCLGGLESQELPGEGGAAQGGIKRSDEPAVGGGGAISQGIRPRHDRRSHVVGEFPLGGVELLRVGEGQS